ncbi:MAG: amidohydrolase family protein [Dehalococcoidales bacterium]
MIIDFHTHIFPPRIIGNRDKYIGSDPCFAVLYSQKKSKMATAEELIDNMDKEGIDISVALNIGWTTHELCVETNDYIMESIARYPDRLIGFCAVQPRSFAAAIDEIERCVTGGIKGVGEMRPDMQSIDLGDEEVMKPLLETLRRHQLPLLVHASEPVGHEYPGKGAVTPEVLYPFIQANPELTIICAHWGGGLPFYSLMPEVKETLSNVFFDTAATPFLYAPQVYEQAVRLAGAERILFGSDYPLLNPGRLLKDIRSVNLSPETEELLLSGNARRLLKI